MISARAVVAGFVLAAVIAAQTTRPETRRDRRHVEPFGEPEALSLWSFQAQDRVAVVTSCGAVYVYESTTVALKHTIHSGASGWMRTVSGDFGGRSIPSKLRGIPVAVHGDDIIAVEPDGRLVAFDSTRRRRVILTDERLADATILRSGGPQGPVLVGTSKGSVLSVSQEGKIAIAPDPLDEAVLAMAVDPKLRWFVSCGEGPSWHVRSVANLTLTKDSGNHIGEEFIYAFDVSKDGQHLAVAHGYTICRIKAFSVDEQGLVTDFDAFRKENGVCTTLAYDSSMRLLVAGDETGLVRVMPSGVGDAASLPRSTRADEAAGGHAGAVTDFRTGKSLLTSDLGSWRVDRTPTRGVCFAAKDTLVVSMNRTGAVVARAWPAGEIKWTATIADLCPSGSASRPARSR